MASYEVQCVDCDEYFTVQMFGPRKKNEWKIDGVKWTCDDCKARQKEQASRAAAEQNAQQGCALLSGSEKQVDWAETIRAEKLAGINTFLKRMADSGDKKADRFDMAGRRYKSLTHPKVRAEIALDTIKAQASAAWWIDRRHEVCEDILWEVLQDTDLPNEQVSKAQDEALEQKIKLEATLFPENKKTDTLAEVRIIANRIEVEFPEFHEDFRDLMRDQYFNWDKQKRCWVRTPPEYKGPVKERAAEVLHRILLWGAPVCCFDESVREMAINASYEPDSSMWVVEVGGSFLIRWRRSDGEFYDAAKRIQGSRWDSKAKGVSVPPEKFAEVEDFAMIHKFKLSPGALALISENRTAYENAPVISPAKIEKGEKYTPDQKPPKLDVPKNVDIDDDLKDEPV